ncbi:MAG: hypothetical protein UIG41_09650 [Gemmiger formicilis]|nr:hypothetical protein [Gemmiger formicilis]
MSHSNLHSNLPGTYHFEKAALRPEAYAHRYGYAGLIFYPGGKVECTAYAPLLHELAVDGMLLY